MLPTTFTTALGEPCLGSHYNLHLDPLVSFRNPTATDSSFYEEIDIPCLGAFGGPVDPNIILGGFNSKLEIITRPCL